jgi:hypothetical protein
MLLDNGYTLRQCVYPGGSEACTSRLPVLILSLEISQELLFVGIFGVEPVCGPKT